MFLVAPPPVAPAARHRRERRAPRCVNACAALSAAEQRFVAWCSAAGASSPALEVAYFPLPGGQSYRGLRATRDVPADVPLLSVPLALCLNSHAPTDWPYAGATPAARLATRLLQAEAEPQCTLQPWLDVLPRDMASLGGFRWPLAQLTADVQSYAPLLALRAKTEALDATAAPHVLGVLGGKADAEAFAWAMAMVRTRAFEVSPGVDIFCPMLDMANHAHEGHHIEWVWQPEARAMEVRTIRPLVAGEEVFTNYGQRDNDGFLLWGGFVAPGFNPHDAVQVFESLDDAAAWWVGAGVGPAIAGREGQAGSVSASAAARVAAAVDAQARQDDGDDVRVAVCLGPDWQVDGRLVDLLEALAAQEACLGPKLAERAAVAAVRARAAQALAAWPTSVAQDEETLAIGGLRDEQAACVQYRAAKKRILEGYLNG